LIGLPARSKGQESCSLHFQEDVGSISFSVVYSTVLYVDAETSILCQTNAWNDFHHNPPGKALSIMICPRLSSDAGY
jgi:hypothetical protein